MILKVTPPKNEVTKTIQVKLVLRDYLSAAEDEDLQQTASANYTGLYAINDIPSEWTVRSEQTYFFKIAIKEYEISAILNFATTK